MADKSWMRKVWEKLDSGILTTASEQTEDEAHADGDTGVQILAVRNDTIGSLADTDGDYTPLQVDSSGALYIQEGSALDVSASTVTVTDQGDFNVAGTVTTDPSAQEPHQVTDDGNFNASTDHTGQESTRATSVTPSSQSSYNWTVIDRDSGLTIGSFFVEETGTDNGGSYKVLTSNVTAANRNAAADGDNHWREEKSDTSVSPGAADQGDFDRRCRAIAVGVQHGGNGNSGNDATFTIEVEGAP